MEEQTQPEMETDSKQTMKKSWIFFMDTLKLGGSAHSGDHKAETWWLMLEGEQLKEGLDTQLKPGWTHDLMKQHL